MTFTDQCQIFVLDYKRAYGGGGATMVGFANAIMHMAGAGQDSQAFRTH